MAIKKEYKVLMLRLSSEAKNKFEKDREHASKWAGVKLSQSDYGNRLILRSKTDNLTDKVSGH